LVYELLLDIELWVGAVKMVMAERKKLSPRAVLEMKLLEWELGISKAEERTWYQW